MLNGNSGSIDNRIFGLDIGTRSVVGIVGGFEGDVFRIDAFSLADHETRSMIDGQIHDIEKATETILSVKSGLELQLGHPLRKVSIAAAGRVLKTAQVHVEMACDPARPIEEDLVKALELAGMEKAHAEANRGQGHKEMGYHCVGYTVSRYYLNDYPMTLLEGHSGKSIGADVLATFLPREVVDSLYAVVAKAGLEVYSLTLEPIAAIGLAIPEKFRLLNIALVDIGAGTSDIAITREGSIVAYGMIPEAGDELTETLMHKYLVEFKTAEGMKIGSSEGLERIPYTDILGLDHEAPLEDVRTAMDEAANRLASLIAEKIMQLNGGRSTSAVFVVGGGGQIAGFTELLAGHLDLPPERVALRGREVMGSIDFRGITAQQRPDLVTPVGICLEGFRNRKGDFIQVYLNEEPIRLFNNSSLTVMDAAAFKGYDPGKLVARDGKSLTYYLNGQKTVLSGALGKPARVFVNGKERAMNQAIAMNDSIVILPSEKGADASLAIGELEGMLTAAVTVGGTILPLRPIIRMEGRRMPLDIQIREGDRLEYDWPTLEAFMSMNGQKGEGRRFYGASGPLEASSRLKPEEIIRVEEESGTAIHVTVNGQPVRLTGKPSYVFVDIFDKIDFDLSKPQGAITCLTNGRKADYMMPLAEGDQLDVFWSGKTQTSDKIKEQT